MVPRSLAAEMAMPLSALAGDGTRRAPSLPMAMTHTTPASTALFTCRASALEPLSPVSSGLSGELNEPKDMEATWMPFDEPL